VAETESRKRTKVKGSDSIPASIGACGRCTCVSHAFARVTCESPEMPIYGKSYQSRNVSQSERNVYW